MGKLAIALKKKFKTPAAAMMALGLDESLLHSDVVGDVLPPALRVRRRALAKDSTSESERMNKMMGGPQRFDKGMDEGEGHAALKAFLRSKGLSEGEVEKACHILDGDLGEDDPPDFGGRPTPGGTITPLRNNSPASLRGSAPGAEGPLRGNATAPAQDSRRLALDAAARIITDYVPPSSRPRPPQIDYSSKTMRSFAERWPEVARIKQA